MLSILLLTLAAPPQFTVENLCPPTFAVVNLCPKAAPVVAAKTFPAFDPDHVCNACGRTVTRIAYYLPTGQHVHVCPCGNAWKH